MRKRGSIILVFISWPVFLFAQPIQHSLFNNADSTTVTGKIDGYSINQEQQLVNYYVYDISGERQKFSTPVQKDGRFTFRFMQLFEGEFDLQYGANFIKLYAQPGEKIAVKIDHDVADKVYHFPGAYKIEGPSASISIHMLKFFAQYLPMMYERADGLSMKLSTVEFIEVVHRYLQKDLDLLNRYIDKNHPPSLFNKWAKNHLTYEAASQIISKPFLGVHEDRLTFIQLTGLLKNIKIQDEEALHNASYYRFLSGWVEGIHMTLGTGRDRGELATMAEEVLQNIDRYLEGNSRQVAYYNSYAWDASSELAVFRLEQVWDKFDSVITDTVIQDQLEQKRNSLHQRFVPFNIGEKIKGVTTDTLLCKNLLSLFEKEKGHFVYIDFWGTWCAPCMADMPHYRSFIQQFNDQPIDFLFLSVKTSLNDSKVVQEKYSIPGKFMALNNSETAIVNQVFGFSSYPSSFIIDPNGNLITKNIRVLNVKDATDLIRVLIKK